MDQKLIETRERPPGPDARGAWDAAAFWGALAVMTALCIAMRLDGATADVSWLISMCERIYDGETAYVDIFETTPPAPALLYMPGVALSRWLPVSAEAAVYATAFGAIFASLWLSARILPARLGAAGPSRWVVLFPAAAFLLLIVNDAFAQREHFAAAFALPIAATFIHHAEKGEWPAVPLRALAAVLAGVSIAVKPPLFAAPGAALALYYLIRMRKIRFVYSSGLLAGGAVGVLLTAVSLAAFPAYLDGVATLMRDVYVPVRLPLINASKGAFWGVAAIFLFAAMLTRGGKAPTTAIALAVSAGYAAVYVVQGKFMAYHLVPAALFGVVALAASLRTRAAALLQSGAGSACAFTAHAAVALGVSSILFTGFEDYRPRMNDLSWAQDLDRPTAMSITPYIDGAFPLARQVEARWVDRIHSQWVANYARYALDNLELSEKRARVARRYYEFDIERTRSVIRDKEPEIIIQTVAPRMDWLHEAIVETAPSPLAAYDVIAEEGVYRIWRRRDEIAVTP